METNHILVVDDDAGLRELLHEYLTAQGFEVSTVQDGAEMTTHLASHIPDIVILDLMLPGEDGLSLVRRLRMQSDLPIIMLSARGEDVDRIVGLEVGADDYLAKPFNPRELLARIRALLRRHGKSQAVEEQSKLDEIRLGSFVLKQGSREFLKNGRGIPLTAGEFNILSVFFENPNRFESRQYYGQAKRVRT